jgi:hypothetical protein
VETVASVGEPGELGPDEGLEDLLVSAVRGEYLLSPAKMASKSYKTQLLSTPRPSRMSWSDRKCSVWARLRGLVDRASSDGDLALDTNAEVLPFLSDLDFSLQ